MTIPLTNEKKVKIHEYAKKLLVGTPSITEIVKFLGNLSSSFESVTYGRLFLGSKKLIKKMHWNFPRENFMNLVYYLLLPRMEFIGGDKTF